MYKIGQLAKIFDMTKEGIRYYEKTNVINPVRNEENGYRYYSEFDFQKLGVIRKLQNINFTLDEVKNIYYKEDKQAIVDTYKKKLGEIKDEIYIKKKIEEILDDQINIIDNIENEISQYREIENIEYYRLNYKTIDDFVYAKNTAVISVFLKNMFLVCASSKVKYNNKIDIVGRGLIVEKKVGDKLLKDIKIPKEMEYISKRKYFYTIIKFINGEYQVGNLNRLYTEYTMKTNKKLGEGFTKVILSYVNEKGDKIIYSELFLEVLDK